MTAPRWQDEAPSDRAWVQGALVSLRDQLGAEAASPLTARRDLAALPGRISALLAALARLAEPEPTDRTIVGRTSSGGTVHTVAGQRRAAEPAQTSAVDAWRNVPGHDRDDLLDWLDGVHRSGMRGESLSPTAHVAVRALLALAREVGGSER